MMSLCGVREPAWLRRVSKWIGLGMNREFGGAMKPNNRKRAAGKSTVWKLAVMASLGGGILLQGCLAVDPDILLRAQLSAGTDLLNFLLDNLVRSI